MRNPLKKLSTIEKLEAELAGKKLQRTKLADRLVAAQQELSRARASVSDLAVMDDDQKLGDAEHSVRNAQDRTGSLSAAVSQTDGEIVAIEKALAGEKDRLERKTSIELLAKLSTNFDVPLARFNEALGELTAAAEEAAKFASSVQGLPPALRAIGPTAVSGIKQAQESLGYLAARFERGEAGPVLTPMITKTGRTPSIPRPAPPEPGRVFDPTRPYYRPPPGVDPAIRN